MSEYEKAEQDVAAAKVAERIAEWKAMEAKAAYYRYASESMAASAEVMGSRIRRDNALAAEFVEKANAVEQDWTPTVQREEITVADLDKLATKASPEERAEMEGQDALAEFMKLPGAVKWEIDVTEQPPLGSTNEVIFESGLIRTGGPEMWHEEVDDHGLIRAFRILEAPAPEQEVEAIDAAEPYPDPTDIHGLDEATAKPFTDLWQQGYDDKANGYDPSLAEPEYTKGYEARALIEREHRETMERAKFFDGGMMADADRHAREQSMMEKAGEALAAIFKREREDA